MTTNQKPLPDVGMLFEEPYNELLPKFRALLPEQVGAVNLEIPAAVTTVLGAQPKVLNLKEKMGAELPQFDWEVAAKMHVYALALSHAQTLYVVASAPSDDLQPLFEEGADLHATLRADAGALAQRKLIDGKRLDDLKGVVGYKNVAFDLQALAQVLRESAEAIQGKSAIQPAEVERAEQIAATLLQMVGVRAAEGAAVTEATDIRNRAFTLFINSYDQVRRAVTYLRWDADDADTIAPSLYAGRTGAGKKKPDAPTPPSPEPGPTPQPHPTPEPAPEPAPTGAGPHGGTASNGTKVGHAGQPFLSGQ